MASEEETLYCLCRRPYEDDQFMIECEICKDWFHGSCVGVKEYQAADIEIYHCPNCQLSDGPLVLKKRRNWHRRDYSEFDNNVSKAVQTGTVVFIRELKHKTFRSIDDLPVPKLRGYELTKDYLEENGFSNPVLVEKKDGLDLKVPPPSFTIQDIENHVGSMREIIVIDVARQEDCKMLMREWTEYYNSPNRPKIYNVISLEFSNTKLAELVEPPRLVHELSWVSQFWPEDQPPEDAMYQRPEVQRYCLMGVKDSFTDFHIDFGGTSVWYHVLRGEKIFFLIEPTPANLALYEAWVSSCNQSEMFFGDQVDACYRCVVKAGQTFFIPTGWIHAVLTPIDSLVFGGNFLHSYNIDLQIQIYELEKRVKTESKYLFPNFETVHWYAAKHIVDTLKDCREESTAAPPYIVDGAKAMAIALKSWTKKKDVIKRDNIPETIQYGRLLKDLGDELKNFNVTVKPKVKSKESKPKKEKAKKKKEPDDSIPPQKATKAKSRKSKASSSASPTRDTAEDPRTVSPKKIHLSKSENPFAMQAPLPKPKLLSSESMSTTGTPVPKLKAKKSLKAVVTKSKSPNKRPIKKEDLPKQEPLESPDTESPEDLKSPIKKEDLPKQEPLESSDTENPEDLKVRIPKFGAYQDSSVYDFSDEPEASPATLAHRRNSSPLKGLHLLSPGSKKDTEESSDEPKKEESVDIESTDDPDAGSSSPAVGTRPGPILKLKVSGGKIIGGEKETPPHPNRLLMSPLSSREEESDTSDGDKDNLVVDEAPKKQRKKVMPQVFGLPNMNLASPKRPLKPKLAAVGKQSDSVSDEAVTGSGVTDDDNVDDDEENFEDRMNMPTIRGGLNGSISDILEASGYGTETDFKTDEDIGRASPTMRDAIQGMLSMSRIGMMSTLVTSASPAEKARLAATRGRRAGPEEDGGEKMPTCFKDEEFVYPTLDVSDNEDDHVFRPRGRPRKDETWNPKAKLNPNTPKPDRPHRDRVLKESVHSGLAAAAAKYAHLPPPKRQYIRRKPKPEKKFESMDMQPSTSSSLGSTLEISLGGQKRPAPPSPVKAKKPRKGMATAKQRLGKILKLHKMMH